MAEDGDLPLVSVIVPTRNSARYLDRCLASIRAQTYARIELVVIDNESTDDTIAIAERYADVLESAGPERSAQVNRGVEFARGDYVYRVDSDFELSPTVVQEAVELATAGYDAVVVHNSPDTTTGRLARIRKFEVDMYKFDLSHSAARFVSREVFIRVGGYNESVTAGEDYDFQNRLDAAGARTGFIDAEAVHLDEPTSLWPHLRKYYAYGADVRHFKVANPGTRQFAFARSVYLRHWRRFLAHPLLGAQFLAYHVAKFGAGGVGYAAAAVRARAVAPARGSSA